MAAPAKTISSRRLISLITFGEFSFSVSFLLHSKREEGKKEGGKEGRKEEEKEEKEEKGEG